GLGFARTDHAVGGRDARGLSWGDHRGSFEPPGADRANQHARATDGDRCSGASRKDVWLLDRRAQPEPGEGGLHDGTARIRRRAGELARGGGGFVISPSEYVDCPGSACYTFTFLREVRGPLEKGLVDQVIG